MRFRTRASALAALFLLVLLAAACRGGASTGEDVSIPEFTPTPTPIECLNDRYPADAPQFDQASTVNFDSTASGVGIATVSAGDGEAAEEGETITIEYTGWLEGGCVFDSSHIRGQPSDFPLERDALIPGMFQGLSGTRVGGERWIRVPPELAYGQRGVPGVIPSNATLVFRVEVVDVQPAAGEASDVPEGPITNPDEDPAEESSPGTGQ